MDAARHTFSPVADMVVCVVDEESAFYSVGYASVKKSCSMTFRGRAMRSRVGATDCQPSGALASVSFPVTLRADRLFEMLIMS